uniref:AzlD domain-containing protein n=1 Tax=Thaumasiovibrio occultus TaxID=1891184 RepID=UPI000B35038F|nr:AzlD domain-containing protein [Thaumasiovibrio occultus]
MLEIIAMAAVVFLSRYLFLEPKLPIRLGAEAQRFLKYSCAAILTVIWAPIVFLTPETYEMQSLHNPFVYGTVLAVVLAYVTKNVLWTVLISMSFFLLLKLVLMA